MIYYSKNHIGALTGADKALSKIFMIQQTISGPTIPVIAAESSYKPIYRPRRR